MNQQELDAAFARALVAHKWRACSMLPPRHTKIGAILRLDGRVAEVLTSSPRVWPEGERIDPEAWASAEDPDSLAGSLIDAFLAPLGYPKGTLLVRQPPMIVRDDSSSAGESCYVRARFGLLLDGEVWAE